MSFFNFFLLLLLFVKAFTGYMKLEVSKFRLYGPQPLIDKNKKIQNRSDDDFNSKMRKKKNCECQ